MFAVERLSLIEAYAASLATVGVERGIIGPREVPRLWERHLLNCGAMAPLLPADCSVADIGSGGGLPGLVLAIARPDVRVTLIEPLLRRTNYLSEVVEDLGLDHVTVHRGRSDSLHGIETFDVVTSRAVAPLERLLPWSMPLVARHGELVAMKGSSVSAEVESVRGSWARWHLAEPRIEAIGEDLPDGGTTVLRVAWAGSPLVSLPAGPGGADRTRSGPRSGRRKR